MTKKKCLYLALLLFLVLISPLTAVLRSVVIMPIYSKLTTKDSLLEKAQIDLKIPGGLAAGENAWYPFVLTFQPGSHFASYTGLSADVTILYNFPAFDPATGASMLYSSDSAYYNSFYGAYLVQSEDGTFGFNADGSLIAEEVVLVPEYDFRILVMESFSLPRSDSVFEWNIVEQATDISYAGSDGWTRITAALYVSGASHNASAFQASYLQYGTPAKNNGSDFSPIQMRGVIYGKYFPEWDTSVFFYAISPDEQVIRACDTNILQKSILRAK